jgi:uncharacterized membrane protein YesL
VIGQALAAWWDDWVNMVVINLIWIVCWVTIVLGPPATLGVYHLTNHLARGIGLGPSGLWEGIKRYFLVSWLWMLLNLLAAVILGVNFLFWAGQDTVWEILLVGVLLFFSVAWLATQFYALPYLVEQKRKNLGLALRNGLFTALSAPGYTLVVAGLAAALAILSTLLVLPLLLGVPILVAALGTWAVRDRLETYGVRDRESVRDGESVRDRDSVRERDAASEEGDYREP